MYRIMIVVSHRDKFETLYKLMTTTIDGVTMPVEIETKEELDKKIKKMLNCDGYSKKDFIVIKTVDYSIDTSDYSDDDVPPDNPGCGCMKVASDEEVTEMLNDVFSE